ncbi:MAG TPA: tetratricopeptide repeat protein, partial [Stellaceae bacterium]|nr:tetratricopeptide repeat protein [Stellaceae bacterium]
MRLSKLRQALQLKVKLKMSTRLQKTAALVAVLALAACATEEGPGPLPVWFKEIQSKAEAGDAPSEARIGALYLTGVGVYQDDAKALQWCRKAATQGNGEGENCLGLLYQYGRGVSQDNKRALDWYRKSTGHKFEPAKANLAALEEFVQLGPVGFENKYMKFLEMLRSKRQAIEAHDPR